MDRLAAQFCQCFVMRGTVHITVSQLLGCHDVHNNDPILCDFRERSRHIFLRSH